MADSKTDAILIFDHVAWHEGDVRHEKDGRGSKVKLPKGEFDRLKEIGAVAAAGSKAAKAAAADQAPPGLPENLDDLSESELRDLAAARGVTDAADLDRDQLVGELAREPSSPHGAPPSP